MIDILSVTAANWQRRKESPENVNFTAFSSLDSHTENFFDAVGCDNAALVKTLILT